MTPARRIKLAGIVAAAVVALVLIVQNRGAVAIHFLFVETRMPAAMLILVTLLIGFVIGVLAAQFVRRR